MLFRGDAAQGWLWQPLCRDRLRLRPPGHRNRGARPMRMLVTGGLAVAAAVGALVVIGPMRSEAKDYGQAAQTFPVIEP